MKRLAIPCLAFFALSSLSAASQDRLLTFTGGVSEGQTFRKDIGRGLDFVLTPSSMGDDATGWIIGVSPQGKQSDSDCIEFSWVVTPPYHFQNVLYLDTSYSTLAQDAVRASPREFSFVLNCTDFQAERRRVELVLHHSTASEQEVDEARAKLGSSPLGKGELWIEDYRITPGKKTDDGSDLGAIHWIRFKVEITFPSGSPRHPRP